MYYRNGTVNFFCIASKNTKKGIANSFIKFYQMVRQKLKQIFANYDRFII